MKTRNAFIRFVLSGMGILLALMLVSSNMRAQSPCPTDIYPTTVSWSSEPPYTYHDPSGCIISIYFCDRTVTIDTTLIYQTTITGVQILDTTGCSGTDLITLAIIGSFKNPHNPNFGNCNQLSIYLMSVYTSCCWKKDAFDTLSHWIMRPCTSEGGYCENTCEMCTSGVNPLRFNCTVHSIGTCSCTTPPPDPWLNTDRTCYFIDCLDVH